METCIGCGAKLEKCEGAHNRYGIASTSCWTRFNELLAHERTQWGYPDVHRLVVDAYAVQHPPNAELQKTLQVEPRLVDASIQSIAVHLIALHFALVQKTPLLEISKLMDRILSTGVIFPELEPPKSFGAITVADAPFTDDLQEYSAFAKGWADETWNAWGAYHEQIKDWISELI